MKESPVDVISSCIAVLEKAVRKLDLRKQQSQGIAKRIKSKELPEAVSEDMMQSIRVVIDSVDEQREHLLGEIKKMTAAKDYFAGISDVSTEEAFMSYIMEDAKLNQKSLTLSFYDYDHIVRSLHHLESRYS